MIYHTIGKKRYRLVQGSFWECENCILHYRQECYGSICRGLNARGHKGYWVKASAPNLFDLEES